VFGIAPGENLGVPEYTERYNDGEIRCMPGMPPKGEQVVDICIHAYGAYAVTIPSLSPDSRG